MAAIAIGAGEAVRGGEGDDCAAPARLGAFGIGDARHRQRRRLGRLGALDQGLGLGLVGIAGVEIGKRAGDLAGIGDAAEGILRHDARHGDRPLDELAEGGGRAVVRRDDGLALAEEHAQAEIVTLGALELLGLAEALGMGDRGALDEHRVGGVGAGAPGTRDDFGEQVQGVGFLRHAAVPSQERED